MANGEAQAMGNSACGDSLLHLPALLLSILFQRGRTHDANYRGTV